MATGYANSRPPVHAAVIERALAGQRPVRRVLDIGCGAGVSTRALDNFAEQAIGMEPAEAMLSWTGAVAPHAEFLVGAAEAMPLASGCADLLTAAGSLNYVDLDAFFPEARRVLSADGAVLVYDFSPGRSFRDSDALDAWFAEFQRRYPPPAGEARALSPEVLAGLESGFRVTKSEHFEIGLTLTPEFYRDYMLTETNVAAAVREGTPYGEIRAWCEDSLGPVWEGRDREVLFRGYWASMATIA